MYRHYIPRNGRNVSRSRDFTGSYKNICMAIINRVALHYFYVSDSPLYISAVKLLIAINLI